MTLTPSRAAGGIRQVLSRDGSAEHAAGVQWFFKEEIKSHGWYTGDLRRFARSCRRSMLKDQGLPFLVEVADRLFSGRVLEEKICAVLMLEDLTSDFDDSQFALFESWLDRISSWADHDGLVHYLIAPMVAAKPARARKVFEWAKSANRWHRRAACVALIQGTRGKLFFPQIVRLSNLLLKDEDDMVQKGLGWLLRETAKRDPERTVPYLLKIRGRAPRLVLRTACETLPVATRGKILEKSSRR
ncbi:MAG TPA: DNA alkylation repair protein [Terriglobales bacterium]|nr:DNA alkylation repair protein [Terriglobales bacterium]